MSPDSSADHRWEGLFRPGTNCWRTEHCGRIGVAFETSAYFDAFRAACQNARRCIFILGWDFDRRERLGREADDPTLEAFLCDLLDRRPELEVFLLIWDYAFVYAAEREWFQEYHLRHRSHERLHVHFDDAHPTGASQHQKVVVVDDRVAFSGGIDLSRWRWDESGHAAQDPRRIDPDGDPYPPFHDLMAVVDGDGARALGCLARDRWRAADARPEAPAAAATDADPWPPGIAVRWRDQSVALARTLPAGDGHDAVREVECLFLDSIARARRYVYIENQYFTARSLTEALAQRLREADGPEVVLVLPRHTGGWLEQVTMDAIRRRRVHQLLEADRHDRLRVFYPHQPGLPEDECISVHAKLMLSDDRFLRIGSANTSNRSMGLDSECDLALLDEEGDGVRGVLHELLAEHLGVEAETMAEARRSEDGVLAAIDRLRGGSGRDLRFLDVDSSAPELDLGGEEDVIDPEEPIDGAYLVQRAVPPDEREQGHRRLYLFLGFIGVLLLGAASWRWTPLGDWLTAERLAGWFSLFDDTWARFAGLLVVIVVTTLLMLPLSALVVASALLLGPWLGFTASMVGALISAAIAFIAGELMGGEILERYSGSRVHALSRSLSDRGVLAVAVLRMMPVAPYTVVNLVAGASHLKLGKFLLGSAIGLVPGIAALSWFSGSLYRAVTEPSASTIGLLAAVLVAIGAGAWFLRRMLKSS